MPGSEIDKPAANPKLWEFCALCWSAQETAFERFEEPVFRRHPRLDQISGSCSKEELQKPRWRVAVRRCWEFSEPSVGAPSRCGFRTTRPSFARLSRAIGRSSDGASQSSLQACRGSASAFSVFISLLKIFPDRCMQDGVAAEWSHGARAS